MSDTTPKDVTTVAATPVLLTSFVYEELLSHVLSIQLQIVNGMKYLHEQSTKNNLLKSHTITLVDPYGNAMNHRYFDHQLLRTVLKDFQKNYIPKYLQSWVKFGEINLSKITPLKESQLNSIVAQLGDYIPQLITYGEVSIWIGNDEKGPFQKFLFPVRLTENIQSIENNLKTRLNATSLEWKTVQLEDNATPDEKHWNDGELLKSEDTILSKNLHQNNSIIMVKTTHEQVYHPLSLSAIRMKFSCF